MKTLCINCSELIEKSLYSYKHIEVQKGAYTFTFVSHSKEYKPTANNVAAAKVAATNEVSVSSVKRQIKA